MKQKRRRIAGGLAAAATGMMACGAWAGPAPGPAAAVEKEATVAIQLFQFKPTPVEVKAGTRVIWTNHDDINHTVTSGTPESGDGRFEGKLSGRGATYSVELTQPGTYPYFCARHQSMRGEIHVNP